jgi:uncharacterized protein
VVAPVATADSQGVILCVRVKPRASKSQVLGVKEGELEVRLAAAPVDGEANRELVRTLARYFGVPRSAISIVSGEASRHKRLRVSGRGLAEVEALLGAG